MMKAEILATGDELRTGALIDSNSAYIAERLEAGGLHVIRHQCVGDDFKTLTAVLKEIGRRADVAVVTGGLGPTADDLSAAAAAKTAGVELLLDENVLKSIEAFFKRRKRPMPPSNKKQAMLPRGSETLFNPIGTAPGFKIKIGKCLFFFLPGVPAEMRRLMEDHVLPAVAALQGDGREHNLIGLITSFGLTESATGEKLAEFQSRFPKIQLGFRATFPEIHIKFYLRGKDREALHRQASEAALWVKERIGRHVLSLAGESMPVVIGNLLRQRGDTLAVAESCTGGLISNLLTDVPGSSDYFVFGGVTYANRSKTDVLGVSAATIRRHGAVHEKTAAQMASGVRKIAGTTYGLATSGIAGPDGGTPQKPVGTLCIGLATPETVISRRLALNFGERLRNKRYFAFYALELLRNHLLDLSDGAE